MAERMQMAHGQAGTADQIAVDADAVELGGGRTDGDDGLAVYPPTAFAGDMHLISIRPDVSNEYRNLAENPADQRGDVAAYPARDGERGDPQ